MTSPHQPIWPSEISNGYLPPRCPPEMVPMLECSLVMLEIQHAVFNESRHPQAAALAIHYAAMRTKLKTYIQKQRGL